MPGPITELSETQIIADMRTELRRLRAAVAASQAPTWTHDTFTAPATYQLTFIPYGINALADNEAVLSEGTDYTVDYTTGLVTFTVARTSGHVIFVSYVTTGDLTALSGPVDTGAITDNFNRADSTTTLNPASDGGTWTIDTDPSASVGVGGIISNQGRVVSNAGGSTRAIRDLGLVACTVTITAVTSGYCRWQVWYAFDPTTHSGYYLDYDGHVHRYSPSSNVDLGLATATNTTDPGTRSISIAYNPTSGAHTFNYSQNISGALYSASGTVTDSSPITGTGNTWVGFWSHQTYSSTGETIDDFSAH